MVDRVGAPYRVLLYQPGIRFSLGTNTKVSSLQHYVYALQGQLLIMLRLVSINLDSSLIKNLSACVATFQLNQEDTYVITQKVGTDI